MLSHTRRAHGIFCRSLTGENYPSTQPALRVPGESSSERRVDGTQHHSFPAVCWSCCGVTFKKSRVREGRTLGSVRAKAEWLSYSTNLAEEANMRLILALLLLYAVALLGASAVDGSSSPGRGTDGAALGSQPRLNIARGCTVTFDPQPNYALCTDPEDAVQLTDGKYVKGLFWTQTGTVGWQGVSRPIIITIDLGKSEPISGASYSTAAGVAGVYWPKRILMWVGDDAKTWRYTGDLVSLSAANGSPLPPDYGVYSAHRFATDGLRTRGRYIQFAVSPTGSLVFCDEIEVYRGSDDFRSTGVAMSSLSEHGRIAVTRGRIATRLAIDLTTVGQAVDASALSEADKAQMHTGMEDIEQKIPALPDPDASLKTVLPLNDLHAAILSIYGRVLSSRGLPSLVAWRKHRYDPVSWMEAPSTAGSPPAVAIRMMGNEYRADAFLLTNATGKPIDGRLEVLGLPGGPRPAWLSVSAVPWTDTKILLPVAAALPEAQYAEGAYSIPVPAGMTRKI